MERIQDFFCIVSKKIFIVLQFFIVGGILLEFGRGTFDVFPLYYQLPNFILALIGLSTISILLVMFYGGRNFGRLFAGKSRCAIGGVLYTLILFTAQIYLCKCIYFCTTWDVGMMQSASDVMAQGGVIQDWVLQNAGDAFAQNYFNAYPNNIFLTVIFAGIKDIAVHFGFADGYFATIVVGVISVDISIVFTVLTVWKLTDSRKLTVLSLIISTVFLGFNPWVVIPYSDAYSISFLSIMMYLYCSLKKDKKGYGTWTGIVIVAMIGMKIKPTVIIALFAIVLVEIFNCNKSRIKELLLKGVILAAGSAAILIMVNCLSKAVYAERSLDAQMTECHYLMMGANEETYGSYFGEDRALSWGISDPQKRKETQLEVWRERIRQKGFFGTIKFYAQKLVIANEDGSFSWKWEGNFFGEYRGLHNELAEKLQSFYYAEDNKMIYNVLQSMWITLQILVCFFAIMLERKKKKELFIALALIGINLFLMIFEVRARYLFLYVPYYIVAAMLGVSYIIGKLKKRTSR